MKQQVLRDDGASILGLTGGVIAAMFALVIAAFAADIGASAVGAFIDWLRS